jgi:hypothetical protein
MSVDRLPSFARRFAMLDDFFRCRGAAGEAWRAARLRPSPKEALEPVRQGVHRCFGSEHAPLEPVAGLLRGFCFGDQPLAFLETLSLCFRERGRKFTRGKIGSLQRRDLG